MTENDINAFKELAESINKNVQDAFRIYEPMVDEMCRNKTKSEPEIQRVLDGILDFCFDDKMLLLFKKLCRYYYDINPEVTSEYVIAYRDLWDEDYLDKNEENNIK